MSYYDEILMDSILKNIGIDKATYLNEADGDDDQPDAYTAEDVGDDDNAGDQPPEPPQDDNGGEQTDQDDNNADQEGQDDNPPEQDEEENPDPEQQEGNDDEDPYSAEEDEGEGGEEGDADTGSDGDDAGDEGEGTSDSEEELDENDPRYKLKSLEKSIFDQLTPEQQQTKVSELKNLYNDVYKKCQDIMNMIGSTEKDPQHSKIYDYIMNNLADLQKYIRDYLSNLFDSKTYIENMTELQKYLTILDTINNIFVDLKTDLDKQFKDEESN